MRQVIIEAKGAVAGNPEYRMAEPLELCVRDGEHICVVGDNAAGKTRLVETLCGNFPVRGNAISYDFAPSPFRLVSENIRYIAFRDTYEGADPNYYHQKRWNQVDIDEDTLTAGQVLDRALAAAEAAAEHGLARFGGSPEMLGQISQARNQLRAKLLSMFGLESLLDKYIITLSSGELRKFQITRMLLTMPRVLILDNPFIGLDAPTRESLSELLGELTRSLDITVILVMSRLDIIPPFITHIIPVEGLHVLPKVPVAQFLAEMSAKAVEAGDDGAAEAGSVLSDETRRLIANLPVKDLSQERFYPQVGATPLATCGKNPQVNSISPATCGKNPQVNSISPTTCGKNPQVSSISPATCGKSPQVGGEGARQGTAPEIVRCNHVSIRYGERTILKELDWVVKEGEKWALSGENGAGKSTLLSLVCADNPQSYACDIELFGHKRGTGESIWDIKRHIGYVSPEMHRSYLKNITAMDVVASGLFDTVGLFMHPTEPQLETCRTWMSIFGIEDLAEKSYLKISSGEQRLCLLARAFVKDPELLILDEPLHGLDARRSQLAKEVIEAFVRRPHKTLIMVSHYQSEFPACIDHSLFLHRQA